MATGRVIVVEGDGLLRARIIAALRGANIGAEECADLEGALSACTAGGVGAVVLDVGVAGAGLRAFCERVGASISIIAIVNEATGPMGHALLSVGAEDFVARPVDPESLALRVRLRLGARRAAHEDVRFTRILDLMRDMVVIVDASRDIIAFTPSSSANFGWDKEEVLGRRMDLLFAEPDEGVRVFNLVRTTGSCGGEVTNQRKDGKWFVSELSGMRLDGDGAAFVFREITRQRAAERALRESEMRYRLVVDQQAELISRSDPLGRLRFVNMAFARKFGIEPEGAIGTDLLDFVHKDDRELVGAQQAKLAPDNPVAICEHRIVGPAGGVAWVRRTDHALFAAEGVLLEVHSTCRDITEQRSTRPRASEPEGRYRLLFEANPAACLVFEGKTGQFLMVNDSAVTSYGYPRAELLKMRIEDLHLEEDRLALRQFLLGLGAGLTRAGVWRQRRRDGTTIYAEMLCHPFNVDGRAGYLVVAHDITELKLAEERLRLSQDRYRRLLENTKAVPWEADAVTHRFLYVGPQASSLLLYRPEEWLVEGFWQDRIHPEMRERILQNWRAAISSGGEFDAEYRLVGRDGSNVWVKHVESLGTAANGDRVLRGFMLDISEMRRAEQRFRAVARAVESTSDPVCIADASGKITHRNPAFIRTFGDACSSLRGEAGLASRFIDRSTMEAAVRAVHGGESWAGRASMKLASGHRAMVLLRADGITHELGQLAGSVWVFTDAGARQTPDAEMIRSSKLESIGLLAGGIAHDFNNLLLIISGNLSLAKMESAEDSPTMALLSEAEKASERAAELAKQLLTFAKGGAPRRRPVRLARVLKETVKFNLHGSKSDGEVLCDDDLWPVMIDEGQIVQALSNLIINAKEAMPQGGTIRVRARNFRLGADEVASLRAGEYVCVRVSDEGIGIAPEVMDKIFDPYYTTKPHGTGLGLLTSYSIIRKHEGLMTVESEPGVGTSFDIYLPADPKALVQEDATPRGPLVTTRFLLREGKGKILVMDDESGVRLTMIKALRRLGYDGHPARNADEAMAAFQGAIDAAEPFDAAILDLTIPRGPGGEEVIKMMREVVADFPAIAFSGYSENPVLANYREYGFAAAMAKPFHIEELARKLGHVIRRRTKAPKSDK